MNVCVLERTRVAATLPLLEASDIPTPDTSPTHDSVRVSRELIERLQAEIKFKQTKIEALNFEIARLLPDPPGRTDARADDRQRNTCCGPAGPDRGRQGRPVICRCTAKASSTRRSGVHIPRSSMAQWLGICGVRLEPLAAALKEFILSHDVIHADQI